MNTLTRPAPASISLLCSGLMACASAWATPSATSASTSNWEFAAVDEDTVAFVSPTGDVGILEHRDADAGTGVRAAPPPPPPTLGDLLSGEQHSGLCGTPDQTGGGGGGFGGRAAPPPRPPPFIGNEGEENAERTFNYDFLRNP